MVPPDTTHARPRRDRRRLAIVAAAGAVLIGLLAQVAPASSPSVPEEAASLAAPIDPKRPRIMVVGDSISQGLEGDYTWRYRLHEHLRSKGVDPQFVGPWTGTTAASRPWGEHEGPYYGGSYRPGISFPSQHMARWGWMMGYAKGEIAAQVRTHTPDHLLVELGFNDIAWDLSDTPADQVATNVLNSFRELVTNARAANPDIRILIADVPQRTPLDNYPTLPGKISAYNNRLDGVIAAVTTTRSPVRRVHFDLVFNENTDAYDGLHPNVRGEYVIAKAFADVLSSAFGIGGTMTLPATMPANLTPGATGAITATVNSDWTADLRWSHVFGAGGYYIWTRNVTLGETELRKLPWPVSATGWKATQLPAGHTIEYAVQTVRGNHAAALSPVKRITAPALRGTTVRATSTKKHEVKLDWDPVPGATDYIVYAGGGCTDIASPTDGYQFVQLGLGSKTTWTHKGVISDCLNYYVVAARNGGTGPKPVWGTRVWTYLDNWYHYWARLYFWPQTRGAGDHEFVDDPSDQWVRKNVGAGPDRGIVVARGFIADDTAMEEMIGDHREFETYPTSSSKATVAWNTATGDVAIHIKKSCVLNSDGGAPDFPAIRRDGSFCLFALPLEERANAAAVSDDAWDFDNYFSLKKNGSGGLDFEFSVLNSLTPAIRAGTVACNFTPFGKDKCDHVANLGRISVRGSLTADGGTFRANLLADPFPSWEFYRYPSGGPLGYEGIAKTIGTRGQTTVFDLKGARPRSCVSPAGEVESPNPRPMSCREGSW